MSAVAILLVIIVVLVVGVALVNAAVLHAWRQDHRQIGLLADRLSTEARMHAHTIETLQRMRDAVRATSRDH